jgi:hypothetical protein
MIGTLRKVRARAACSLGGELYAPVDLGRGGPGGRIIPIGLELHCAD